MKTKRITMTNYDVWKTTPPDYWDIDEPEPEPMERRYIIMALRDMHRVLDAEELASVTDDDLFEWAREYKSACRPLTHSPAFAGLFD